MKKLFILIIILTTAICSYAVERPSTEHQIHFKGTDYELHVFKIYGRQDGKTMLVVGGIQGDEPGGFLSADLYSDLKLEKGNLIVIPRANFKSIILYNRGADGDMNRRFVDEQPTVDMDKVVTIIKDLMSESDVFLNLHDGWGFHYPKYVDKWRNPYKFGQSIITDANQFNCDNGEVLDLEKAAKTVLKEVNSQIPEEDHHLHYFNTKTEDPKHAVKGMSKSATYYALKNYCVPSFGVESSKNLPTLEMKILHHNYAVNSFMSYYDIIPEHPRILLAKPKLTYAVISVNGEPKIIDNEKTLKVEKGDLVEITHIESNYNRGISCDILGHGDLNDYRKKITVQDNTKLVFRKDSQSMGYINIAVKKPNGNGKYFVFIVKHNGEKKAVLSGGTLNVKNGDSVELIMAMSENACGHDYPINFKGYVPPAVGYNNGDDRGYNIIIGSGGFMRKYSRDNKGKTYPVTVSYDGQELGKMWVKEQ